MARSPCHNVFHVKAARAPRVSSTCIVKYGGLTEPLHFADGMMDGHILHLATST
jgi:hypothetical protein